MPFRIPAASPPASLPHPGLGLLRNLNSQADQFAETFLLLE